MSSQTPHSRENGTHVRDQKNSEKGRAASTATIDAHRMTFGEREDEREAISHARPGGFERVVNEQRLPAEGIGAPGGPVRHAFTEHMRHVRHEARDMERPGEIRY